MKNVQIPGGKQPHCSQYKRISVPWLIVRSRSSATDRALMCRRNFTCRAITSRKWSTCLQPGQGQLWKSHFLRWPFRSAETPWMRHFLHFGSRSKIAGMSGWAMDNRQRRSHDSIKGEWRLSVATCSAKRRFLMFLTFLSYLSNNFNERNWFGVPSWLMQ